jgi:hypothetical protein
MHVALGEEHGLERTDALFMNANFAAFTTVDQGE